MIKQILNKIEQKSVFEGRSIASCVAVADGTLFIDDSSSLYSGQCNNNCVFEQLIKTTLY